MLNFAIQTARDAGHLIAERLGRISKVHNKGEIELLTESHLASEKLIIDRIKTFHPRHAILAEESGEAGSPKQKSEWKWIVDPLDGTTNYAHGYPCFCVSIALEHNGTIELGVVYDPMRDEMFTAERGQGILEAYSKIVLHVDSHRAVGPRHRNSHTDMTIGSAIL